MNEIVVGIISVFIALVLIYINSVIDIYVNDLTGSKHRSLKVIRNSFLKAIILYLQLLKNKKNNVTDSTTLIFTVIIHFLYIFTVYSFISDQYYYLSKEVITAIFILQTMATLKINRNNTLSMNRDNSFKKILNLVFLMILTYVLTTKIQNNFIVELGTEVFMLVVISINIYQLDFLENKRNKDLLLRHINQLFQTSAIFLLVSHFSKNLISIVSTNEKLLVILFTMLMILIVNLVKKQQMKQIKYNEKNYRVQIGFISVLFVLKAVIWIV